ncbi:MAG: hypothetical protein AB9866_29670 [Syntrophobacteraceae bacterium]
MSKDNDLDLKRWELEAELRKLRIPFTSEESDSLLKKRYKSALNALWIARASRGKVIRRRKKEDQPAPPGKVTG